MLSCLVDLSVSGALPGQPFASYWHPSTLLTWNPTNDADSAFNRANIPLAARFSHPALNVNVHAKTNQAKVVSLSAFGVTSGNPSQGTLSMNYFAHNYWQYEDVLVFWGGSAGEGLILAPNPTVIDAAHRNGVPVLGNIFLPPTAFGGQFQWVTDFLQKSGSTFPVADKLIQAAQYYGFDGWFINQETAGGSATTATTMRDFIKYIHANSSLHVMWYDAMNESGSVGWQNQLNTANDMFFYDAGRVSDEMFLNFSWSSGGLSSSRTRAQSFGRSEFDVYAGVDVEGNGYNTSVNWAAIFPEGGAHVLSLGFYRPDWCYNSSSSPTDFYARENRFWVGPAGDPSNTSSTNAWAGIAHYVAARTPVTKVPFVTSFNTGQGSRYAIGGQTLMTGNWNNLSVQDVLPTWRWIVQSSGTKLTPSLDWADAYYGGTSLRVTGTLDSTNTILLYETSLAVSNDTQIGITYKIGTASAPTYMKLAVAFEDSPTNYQFFDVAATTNANWNTQTFSLGAFAGKKLALIALRFGAGSVVSGYTMRIGKLAVWNGVISTPTPPSAIVVDRVSAVDATTATARLKWTHSPSIVAHYNVYRRNADNSRTWLGATPNNAYFVPQVKRVGGESFVPIEIETVAPDHGVSIAATTNLFWPVTLVSTGSVWKYNDTGANLGTTWRATNYDDFAWSAGAAMLGYGDANGIFPTTTNSYGLDPNNKYITTYYRRAFVVNEEPTSYKGLTLNVQRDDGAVVYLNGVEVFRSNMPGGTVNYLTLASSGVSGGDEAAFFSTNLPSSVLLAGTNFFAVELHQNTNNSSDIAFDLSLSGQLNAAPSVAITSPADGIVLATNLLPVSITASDLDGTVSRLELFANDQLIGSATNAPYQFMWTNIPIGFHLLTTRATDNLGRAATSAVVNVTSPGIATAPITLIATGAVWRYFDMTNHLGENWRSNSFNDASWSSGASELGFGDVADGRPETTLISNRLQITFYFRRAFYVAEPTFISDLTARLLRDDGAVVYLNGAEVWRDNLPAGAITNGTPATATINGVTETVWLTNSLPRSALIRGTNWIAAEIHQQATNSSDVSFNFQLTGSAMIPVQPQLDFTTAGSLSFTWPADQGLFSLYAATNVAASTWTRITNVPTLANGVWILTLPQTNSSSRFFQLRYP